MRSVLEKSKYDYFNNDPDDFEGGGLQIEDQVEMEEWTDTPHNDRGVYDNVSIFYETPKHYQ